jgi:hypothetical protein
MSIHQLSNRVLKLERLLPPTRDRTYTLEEICRSMWRQNKSHLIEIAKNNSYQLFVYQFEREDAEAAAARSGRFSARRRAHAGR